MTKTIAIQGYAASFHDQAARQFFGQDIKLIPCNLPFSKVFEAFLRPGTDFAVCAIENSLYGAINDVYDLLREHRPWICGEVVLHIEQCLIGLPGVRIEQIAEVYSHPVAISQCKEYLLTTLPQAREVEADDTAASVELIAKLGDPTKAAIAAAAAAELHGMQVLRRGIETNHHNYTRFVVLSRQATAVPPDANKTSIILELPHQPGALQQAIGTFAEQHINLSLLTSRPIVGQPGRYRFYLDFEAGLNDPRTKRALQALEQNGRQVLVLGSYKSTPLY